MNTKITLAVAAIAGTALMLFRCWKQRSATAEKADQHRRTQQLRPPGYRPLPDLSQADAPDIVALQYADLAISSDRNNHATDFSKNMAYHQKGTRHH